VLPFFALNLAGEKFKTKPTKSAEPVWEESFTFSLIGVDKSSELECVCYNNKMASGEFIGELFLPLSKFEQYQSTAKDLLWFPLRTNTSTRGEVNVLFEIQSCGDYENIAKYINDLDDKK